MNLSPTLPPTSPPVRPTRAGQQPGRPAPPALLPETGSLPTVQEDKRCLILCAIHRRLLAKFDPARLSGDARLLLSLLDAVGGVLWVYCKHCKDNHRLDFATLVRARGPVLWVGMRQPLSPPPPGPPPPPPQHADESGGGTAAGGESGGGGGSSRVIEQGGSLT